MEKYVKFNNVDQHLILVLQFLSNYLWIMKKTLNTNQSNNKHQNRAAHIFATHPCFGGLGEALENN